MNCVIFKLAFTTLLLTDLSKRVEGSCALLEIADCPSLSHFCPEVAVCSAGSEYKTFPDGTCCCEPIDRCGPNERYLDCGSGCGDPTCLKRNFTDVACPAVCRTGCFCIHGFVRNHDGECVPEERCNEKVCQDNEEFKSCGCPDAHCGDSSGPSPSCKECQPDCYCKPGFKRNWDLNCIAEADCVVCNKPNEHFEKCGKQCEGTCENPFAKDCPKDVCFAGCVCDLGYVRGPNDTCTPVAKCYPMICEENMQFSECAANACQATCAAPDLPTRCKAECVPGCVCADGYVLNEEGICIKLEACKKCPENELFTCGCADRRCDAPNDVVDCTYCSTYGCFCEEGHFRDTYGNCVPWASCPKPK